VTASGQYPQRVSKPKEQGLLSTIFGVSGLHTSTYTIYGRPSVPGSPKNIFGLVERPEGPMVGTSKRHNTTISKAELREQAFYLSAE
jgi:hypothetical protein